MIALQKTSLFIKEVSNGFNQDFDLTFGIFILYFLYQNFMCMKTSKANCTNWSVPASAKSLKTILYLQYLHCAVFSFLQQQKLGNFSNYTVLYQNNYRRYC